MGAPDADNIIFLSSGITLPTRVQKHLVYLDESLVNILPENRGEDMKHFLDGFQLAIYSLGSRLPGGALLNCILNSEALLLLK